MRRIGKISLNEGLSDNVELKKVGLCVVDIEGFHFATFKDVEDSVFTLDQDYSYKLVNFALPKGMKLAGYVRASSEGINVSYVDEIPLSHDFIATVAYDIREINDPEEGKMLKTTFETKLNHPCHPSVSFRGKECCGNNIYSVSKDGAKYFPFFSLVKSIVKDSQPINFNHYFVPMITAGCNTSFYAIENNSSSELKLIKIGKGSDDFAYAINGKIETYDELASFFVSYNVCIYDGTSIICND